MLARLIRLALVVYVGLELVTIGAAEDKKPDSDDKAIQGEWKVVSLEIGGRPAPANAVAAMRLVFQGEEMTTKEGQTVHEKAKIKLDPAKTPKAIDIVPSEGPGKGETSPGIYELNKDQLKICFVNARGGGTRPKEFKSNGNTGVWLYVLERATEKK